MSGKKSDFVKFEQVDKSYDGKELVVKGLDLDIAEGEFLTLLGPSGSGKTTTLMMLAGFETPTNGEIYFDGNPINNIPPHKRGIGMVFQNYALFPHLSVFENLAFPLKVRKIDKAEIEERINKTLKMVSLTGFENRMPAQLSGGQQQRVAVARALVFDPKLVLMDEPTAAISVRQVAEVLDLIKRLKDQGIAVLLISHRMPDIFEVCEKLVVLRRGEKVCEKKIKDSSTEEATGLITGAIDRI